MSSASAASLTYSTPPAVTIHGHQGGEQIRSPPSYQEVERKQTPSKHPRTARKSTRATPRQRHVVVLGCIIVFVLLSSTTLLVVGHCQTPVVPVSGYLPEYSSCPGGLWTSTWPPCTIPLYVTFGSPVSSTKTTLKRSRPDPSNTPSGYD